MDDAGASWSVEEKREALGVQRHCIAPTYVLFFVYSNRHLSCHSLFSGRIFQFGDGELWVCVCICVCVCLHIESQILRVLELCCLRCKHRCLWEPTLNLSCCCLCLQHLCSSGGVCSGNLQPGCAMNNF